MPLKIPCTRELGQVAEDGSLNIAKEPYFAGFPAFKKHWSLTASKLDPQTLLLEGTIKSTNRGNNKQGVHVYVQYGDSVPFLLAISDADGKIKMRLRRERTQMRQQRLRSRNFGCQLTGLYPVLATSRHHVTR